MGMIQRSAKRAGRSLVMGVVNATPDSFYPESRRPNTTSAVETGVEMVNEGADLIDVGGESTRPGSKPVAVEEELERVVPVVQALTDRVQVPISVDTRRARVAQAALAEGASIVNDTSAGRDDPDLLTVVAEQEADVVLMHRQGDPATMQEDPSYEAVVPEVSRFLQERAQVAQKAGIEEGRVVLDPGIGFGKRLEHNLALIASIEALTGLGYPVLLGVSRKSMFGGLLDRDVEDRLPGSLAVAAWAAQRGVAVLRVHDVQATRDVVATIQALEEAG